MKYLFSISLMLILGECISQPIVNDKLVTETMQKHGYPGLAIGIVKNGGIDFLKSYGVSRLGGDSISTKNSVFHMASVTKTFVAAAIITLVEKGMVNLDSTITTYLPYFKMADSRYKTITIRHLLSHSSGITDVENYEWDNPQFDDLALERYVKGLANDTLLFNPGEKFSYSNKAFEILGDIIAKVSKTTFETYVKKNVLDPSGMTKSTLLLVETDSSERVMPHIFDDNNMLHINPIFPYNRKHSPSSTLYSTPEEMCNWVLMNLSKGKFNNIRVLQEESFKELWSKTTAMGDLKNYGVKGKGFVGLSWFSFKYGKNKVIIHAGSDQGFQTFVGLIPKRAIGVVLMANAKPKDFHIATMGLALLKILMENTN